MGYIVCPQTVGNRLAVGESRMDIRPSACKRRFCPCAVHPTPLHRRRRRSPFSHSQTVKIRKTPYAGIKAAPESTTAPHPPRPLAAVPWQPRPPHPLMSALPFSGEVKGGTGVVKRAHPHRCITRRLPENMIFGCAVARFCVLKESAVAGGGRGVPQRPSTPPPCISYAKVPN